MVCGVGWGPSWSSSQKERNGVDGASMKGAGTSCTPSDCVTGASSMSSTPSELKMRARVVSTSSDWVGSIIGVATAAKMSSGNVAYLGIMRSNGNHDTESEFLMA